VSRLLIYLLFIYTIGTLSYQLFVAGSYFLPFEKNIDYGEV